MHRCVSFLSPPQNTQNLLSFYAELRGGETDVTGCLLIVALLSVFTDN